MDLQNQAEMARSINAMLEQLNAMSACGPNCQKERKIQELKQAYDQALKNDKNEGKSLNDARKNYFTYAFGEKYYQEKEREILSKVADDHIKKLNTKHNNLVSEIKRQKKQKVDNEIAFDRMEQLQTKYVTSNDKLLNTMDNREAVVETSQRKVYYTTQKMDRLQFYQKLVSIFLKILLFVSFFYFIYKKKYVSLVIILVYYLLMRHFS